MQPLECKARCRGDPIKVIQLCTCSSSKMSLAVEQYNQQKECSSLLNKRYESLQSLPRQRHERVAQYSEERTIDPSKVMRTIHSTKIMDDGNKEGL